MCIVKPLSVRRYAGAIEQLAKTDKIDAAVIAEFAAVIQPRPTPARSRNLIRIKDLLARSRQVWTRECEDDALHGNAKRHDVQACHQGFLPTIGRARKTQEGRDHGVHAQVHRHSECDAKGQYGLAELRAG